MEPGGSKWTEWRLGDRYWWVREDSCRKEIHGDGLSGFPRVSSLSSKRIDMMSSSCPTTFSSLNSVITRIEQPQLCCRWWCRSRSREKDITDNRNLKATPAEEQLGAWTSVRLLLSFLIDLVWFESDQPQDAAIRRWWCRNRIQSRERHDSSRILATMPAEAQSMDDVVGSSIEDRNRSIVVPEVLFDQKQNV